MRLDALNIATRSQQSRLTIMPVPKRTGSMRKLLIGCGGVVGSLVVSGLLFVAVGTFRTHQQAAQERAIQTIGGNPVH